MDEQRYAELVAREDAEIEERVARGDKTVDVTLLIDKAAIERFKAAGRYWRVHMAKLIKRAVR